MRIALSIIFVVLVLIIGLCAFLAFKSRRPIGKSVSLLLLCLIPPIVGNLFIIASEFEMLSTVGCYIYFVGMDLVMYALMHFSFDYMGRSKDKRATVIILGTILTLDAIQIFLNPIAHHAFTMTKLDNIYGSAYWKFVPHWGQTIHRVIDYGILGGVVLNFFIKTIKTPKVYAEKYLVILITMLAVTAWQTFYIASGRPMELSKIGFGVFGLIVFLLAIFYRPLRLLDRMLASIASKMPESLFFFDKSGRCIWANDKGLEFLNITTNDYDKVHQLLVEKLGEFEKEGNEWVSETTQGANENVTGYTVEKIALVDKNKLAGYYYSVRDVTRERRAIQKESYKATHDSLTGAYNRAGYDEIISQNELSNLFIVLLDIDCFKETNDTYGHLMGDDVLIKLVEIMKNNVRDIDYVCRIGGDEFCIVVKDAGVDTAQVMKERIQKINEEFKTHKKLHTTSISAGAAFGRHVDDPVQMFANADKALYTTKKNGKDGFTLYDK